MLKTLKTLKTFKTPQNSQNTFESYQGVHDHDVLVDIVHFSEGDKMQLYPKLENYHANQD